MHHHLARKLAGWLIACMALACLHSALAAALLLGRVSQGDVQMVEVCTSQGVRWVGMQSTETPAQTGSAGTDDGPDMAADGSAHCPLCRFALDAAPDLLRSDLRFAQPEYRTAHPPEPPAQRSTAARIVLTAPPRAPPARV
ncbi:MAG: DUF2946 family protein [Acidovorax sp.]|nr:DUF2946 family protein [Acidovorax sp.]